MGTDLVLVVAVLPAVATWPSGSLPGRSKGGGVPTTSITTLYKQRQLPEGRLVPRSSTSRWGARPAGQREKAPAAGDRQGPPLQHAEQAEQAGQDWELKRAAVPVGRGRQNGDWEALVADVLPRRQRDPRLRPGEWPAAHAQGPGAAGMSVSSPSGVPADLRPHQMIETKGEVRCMAYRPILMVGSCSTTRTGATDVGESQRRAVRPRTPQGRVRPLGTSSPAWAGGLRAPLAGPFDPGPSSKRPPRALRRCSRSG